MYTLLHIKSSTSLVGSYIEGHISRQVYTPQNHPLVRYKGIIYTYIQRNNYDVSLLPWYLNSIEYVIGSKGAGWGLGTRLWYFATMVLHPYR